MIILGTHNLHDETGTPTAFADVIVFTEAIAGRVRDELGGRYDIYPCPLQRDLVIAFRKGIWVDKGWRYRLAHPGLAKVTPHRGTYKRKGLLNGERVKVYAEHRINAAFPPYRRGESVFRPAMWNRHTRMTLRMIRRDKRRGWKILAAGDLNTPRGISGYDGLLHEVGSHFDRLGATTRLRNMSALSRMGSDHPRITARVG